MAIEAPLSKYKKTNFMIYIAVLLVAAIWFGYDGYFNEKFKAEHTDEDGTPNSTLAFNQKAPPFLAGGAILFGVYLFVIRNRKIIADENRLILSSQEEIPYDAIQKIDKTYYDKKGSFIITYTNRDGNEAARKLNNRTYDNMDAVLEHLVSKIS